MIWKSRKRDEKTSRNLPCRRRVCSDQQLDKWVFWVKYHGAITVVGKLRISLSSSDSFYTLSITEGIKWRNNANRWNWINMCGRFIVNCFSAIGHIFQQILFRWKSVMLEWWKISIRPIDPALVWLWTSEPSSLCSAITEKLGHPCSDPSVVVEGWELMKWYERILEDYNVASDGS